MNFFLWKCWFNLCGWRFASAFRVVIVTFVIAANIVSVVILVVSGSICDEGVVFILMFDWLLLLLKFSVFLSVLVSALNGFWVVWCEKDDASFVVDIFCCVVIVDDVFCGDLCKLIVNVGVVWFVVFLVNLSKVLTFLSAFAWRYIGFLFAGKAMMVGKVLVWKYFVVNCFILVLLYFSWYMCMVGLLV